MTEGESFTPIAYVEADQSNLAEGHTQPPLFSPYFEVAVNEVRKKTPEKEEIVTKLLRDIDQQAVSNYALFSSEKFPGVTVPYTKVSVLEVARHAFPYQFPEVPSQPVGNIDSQQTDQQEKVMDFVFMGWAKPPGGHAFTAWPMVYNRVISSLAKEVRPLKNPAKDGEVPPDIEVIALGSPNGLGGKVTKEWIENLKNNGLAPYGELYAELVTSLLPEDENKRNHTRIDPEGISIGTTIAKHTVANLSDTDRARVNPAKLINPVGIHKGKIQSAVKAVQISAGFIGEVVGRMAFDDKVKVAVSQEAGFLDAMKAKLQQKGLPVEDNSEQMNLKNEAATADRNNTVKSATRDIEDVRAYEIRAIHDPVTSSPKFIKETVQKARRRKKYAAMSQEERSEQKVAIQNPRKNPQYAIAGTHFVNFYKAKRWGEIIDYCESRKEESAKTPQQVA